jgi:hypothetical protein
MIENNVPQNQIQIDIDEQTFNGVYCNLAAISHTETEVIMDFIYIHPPKGRVRSRVITSPAHAKRLLKALQENLVNYEKTFGPIKEAAGPPQGIQINLGPNLN